MTTTVHEAVRRCLNPPLDNDGDQDLACVQAIQDAAAYIEHFPCLCRDNGTDTPDRNDQCCRCGVLGRYLDKPLRRTA